MFSRRIAAILLLILATRTAAFSERPAAPPSLELGRAVFSKLMLRAEKAWHGNDRHEALRCYHAAKQTARAYGLALSSRDEALISYITRHEAGLAGPQPTSSKRRLPGCDTTSSPVVAGKEPVTPRTQPEPPQVATPPLPVVSPRAIPKQSTRTLAFPPPKHGRVRLPPITPPTLPRPVVRPSPQPAVTATPPLNPNQPPQKDCDPTDLPRSTPNSSPRPPGTVAAGIPAAPDSPPEPPSTTPTPDRAPKPASPTDPPAPDLIPSRGPTSPSSAQDDNLVPPITLPAVGQPTPGPIAVPAPPTTTTQQQTPSPDEDVPTTRPATSVVLSGESASGPVPILASDRSSATTMSQTSETRPQREPEIATRIPTPSAITSNLVFWMVIGPIILALLLLGLMTQEMPGPSAFARMLRSSMRWPVVARHQAISETGAPITLTPPPVSEEVIGSAPSGNGATLLVIRVAESRRSGQLFYTATVVLPGIEPAKVLRRSDGEPLFRSRAAALSSARHVALKIGYAGIEEIEPVATKRVAA